MDTIEISPFQIENYDEVYALWLATPGVGLSTADSREAIGAYLARNPGCSFLARVDGQLAGAVICGHDGRRGYLHHLAVLPAFRRRGIGAALVERCMTALAGQGIDKCHLFVFANNSDGRAFWEKVGWKLRTDLVIMSRNVP